jgi:hypothetical protein
MMRVRLGAIAAVTVLALAVATPASAQEDSQLGGYVAGAAGWAVSFQPFIPALLPTGDAPFETTLSLSSAMVKSGGNALGRGAIFWPGSAAANLGPLLAQGAGNPIFAALVPPYPGFVEASARDGVVERSVSPLVSMRAFGSPTRAEGDAREPDVNVPGVLKIDSVSSNSIAEVTDVDVTSGCTVHLEGVSLLSGAITIKDIYSRSTSSSTGSTGTSDGDLQVAGVTVAGIAATLTADGLTATNQKGVPVANPDAALNTALKSLGVTIKLTRSVENVSGGTADRLANGVYISINNPAVPGSHLDITLASTGSAAQATLPGAIDTEVSGLDLSAAGGASGTDVGLSSSSGLGPSGASSDFASTPIGSLAVGAGATATGAGSGSGNGDIGALPSLATYHFKGVPWQAFVVVLIITAFVARWLRRFLQARLLS